MHISELSLVNYRNFPSSKFHFDEGINTIIGENGSGKTNVLRAIRLILDDRMFGSLRNFDESEFSRSIGDWRGHWLIIGVKFAKLSDDESFQALIMHGTAQIGGAATDEGTYNLIYRPNEIVRKKLSALAAGDIASLSALQKSITSDDYEILFTGRSIADFTDANTYKRIVGDFDHVIFPGAQNASDIGVILPSSLSIKREVSLTYIQALRDVLSEFRDAKTNPLSMLLKAKSGGINESDFTPISDLASRLNSEIEVLSDVAQVSNEIKETLLSSAGSLYSPKKMTIKSDVPTNSTELFQSLKLFVGEFESNYQGSISELSLGGANLIFLALKLLDFKYRKNSAANFLLIEEPEAHIHTHIQKTLFDRINESGTQILYTTHSPQISEVCKISKMNVICKHENASNVCQPSNGLSPTECRKAERYLDAIRSNLLFARSVILVEGDAEEILMPILVKLIYGKSFDELGISLLNVRSTGFITIAQLFHQDRIRKYCAIITDLDQSITDTTMDPSDDDATKAYKKKCLESEKSGSSRKTILDNFCNGNPWLKTFYSPHTFEVDYCSSKNAIDLQKAATVVYSQASKITTVQNNLCSLDVSIFGKQALEMAEYEGKGWFSLILADYISPNSNLPDNVIKAISFALGKDRFDEISSFIRYRMYLKISQHHKENEAKAILDLLPLGPNNHNQITKAIMASFPDDAIAKII